SYCRCPFLSFRAAAPTALSTLSLHDALPILRELGAPRELVPLATVDDVLASRTRLLAAYQSARYAQRYADFVADIRARVAARPRSEEHTSELQSRENLVCRLLLEKKKKKNNV